MPRDRSRSRSPLPRRRSRSPPPRDRDRDRDRDYRRDDRERSGSYRKESNRDRDRDYDRRREERPRSRERERERRDLSPGRPSLALDKSRSKAPLPSQQELAGSAGVVAQGADGEKAPVKAIEPNFGLSGALAAETNTFNGVVLKYNEPPEARKPVRSWRLYVFKGKEQVDLFHVHKQSAYLFGRDRIVADIPVDHPSTSKQHAVLQFRQIYERNEFGDSKTLTKPFVIDLESANGTTVNDETVPASRYYELKSGDVLKFAFSTREYVLLAES